MRRTITVLMAAVCGLFFGPAAFAQAPPTIYVNNASSVVTDQQVQAALPAFQVSVSRDLAAVWGVDAYLTTDPDLRATAAMEIGILDDADVQGALGYHDVAVGKPYAKVFARTGAQYGEDWRLTFSHELDEMLVDPWINHFAIWNNKNWLVEVCDPPESGAFAYFIFGVPISDFISPRFYNASLKGRFDFTGHIKRAGQILKGGYASYRNPDGSWGQVTNWRKVFGLI